MMALRYQIWCWGGISTGDLNQSLWRHQMETFSALLALWVGNSPVTGEFPLQRPVTRSFDVFSDLRLNKRLSKQSRRWWFETPSRLLWRHCNAWSIPLMLIPWPLASLARQRPWFDYVVLIFRDNRFQQLAPSQYRITRENANAIVDLSKTIWHDIGYYQKGIGEMISSLMLQSMTKRLIINLTWDFPKMSSLTYGRAHILSHAWRDRGENARFSKCPLEKAGTGMPNVGSSCWGNMYPVPMLILYPVMRHAELHRVSMDSPKSNLS